MDKESSCGIGMRLLAPRQNNQSYLFWLPIPAGLGQGCCWKINPGKSTAVRRSCFHPHSTDIDYKLLHTHTHMHSLPLPRSLASVTLNRQPDGRVCGQRQNSGRGTGWLPAAAGLLPLWLCHVPMVYVLLLRCFSCSHTVLPKEHSLGVIFFLLSFLVLCCNFLKFPVFLSCLPLVIYVCMLCMGRLMANFTGTCDY